MIDKDLTEFGLFKNIEAKYLERFKQLFTEQTHIKQGETLFRKGDEGDSMYLILAGQLQVQLNDDDDHIQESNRVTFNINPGYVLGEICVFEQKSRTATIVALADTELLIIDGITFRKLINERDIGALLISYNISKVLCQRVITANIFINKLQQITNPAVVKSEIEHFRDRFFDESLFN